MIIIRGAVECDGEGGVCKQSHLHPRPPLRSHKVDDVHHDHIAIMVLTNQSHISQVTFTLDHLFDRTRSMMFIRIVKSCHPESWYPKRIDHLFDHTRSMMFSSIFCIVFSFWELIVQAHKVVDVHMFSSNFSIAFSFWELFFADTTPFLFDEN